MAIISPEATLKLRLDLEGARKDVKKIEEERERAIGPAEAPSLGVREKKTGEAPSMGRRGPGGGGSGRTTPGLSPGENKAQKERQARTEKEVSKIRARGVVQSVVNVISAIPGVELGAVALGGAALVDRFGPGLLSGIGSRIAYQKMKAKMGNSPDAEATARIAETATRASLRSLEAQFEALSDTVSEVKSWLGAVLDARSAIGDEMRTRGLVSEDPSMDGILGIGQAAFKIGQAQRKLRKRGEFLERKGFNHVLGSGVVDLGAEVMDRLAQSMSK